MFTKLAPQKAQHASGFIVQVADPQTVEYIDGPLKASVGVEFGPVSTLYGSTLKASDKSSSNLVEARKAEIEAEIGG